MGIHAPEYAAVSDEPVPPPSDPVIPRAPGTRPQVREGISMAPQIEIGKSVGEPLNVTHMLPLPADTPFRPAPKRSLRGHGHLLRVRSRA